MTHLNLCQLLSKTCPVFVLSLELLQSHLLAVGLHLLGALLTPLLLQLVQPGVQLQTELQTLASQSEETQASCWQFGTSRARQSSECMQGCTKAGAWHTAASLNGPASSVPQLIVCQHM